MVVMWTTSCAIIVAILALATALSICRRHIIQPHVNDGTLWLTAVS